MSFTPGAAEERSLYQFIITKLQFYQKGENSTTVMNIIRYSLMYLAKVLDFVPVPTKKINIVWIHPS